MHPDLEVLKTLNTRLNPPRKVGSKEPELVLTETEWDFVKESIQKHRLATELVSLSDFGRYGIVLYTDAPYPGTPPTPLLLVSEDHLPGVKPEKTPGCGCARAWEVFTAITNTQQNMAWIRFLGLRLPQSRSHYDY